MFNKNLVMAIKVNGKVLREFDGTVALPFGSEYSIYLKNTSSRRASVKIFIDGTDATKDVSLIVNAGESAELKRFIKNGNLNAGNAFKFIEKTAQIESYRGNNAEDGLLTVSYEFEYDYKSYDKMYPYNNWPYCGSGINNSNILRSHTQGGGTTTKSVLTANNQNSTFYANDLCANDSQCQYSASAQTQSGITAPGSIVEQQFNTVHGFISDGVKHSMTIRMVGELQGQHTVKEAIVVKKLQRCSMCGTNTKQTAKFCHNCGASVRIV